MAISDRIPDDQLDQIPDVHLGVDGLLSDGEVIGVLDDGTVAFWDAAVGEAYATGDTVETLDLSALGVLELERLERDAFRIGCGETFMALRETAIQAPAMAR